MKLIICPTPIGNLKDITIRALESLQNCDIIAAEDTRRTLKLLSSYEISKKVIRYDANSSNRETEKLIDIIEEGKSVVLVSDAGMPLISDPGGDLVKKCIEKNIFIEVLPGACALVNAVVASSIYKGAFYFHGFLPNKKINRIKELSSLKEKTEILVFYESPKRIYKLIKDMLFVFGNRKVNIFREMTKVYEEHIYTDLISAAQSYKNKDLKGEFVVVIEGFKSEEKHDIKMLLQKYIDEGFTRKDSINLVASITGEKKSVVYKTSIEMKK